jgi:hypothetical protein
VGRRLDFYSILQIFDNVKVILDIIQYLNTLMTYIFTLWPVVR